MASLPTLAPLLKAVPTPLRRETKHSSTSHSSDPSTTVQRRRRSIDADLLRASDEELALPVQLRRYPSPFARADGTDDDELPRLKPVVITKRTEIEMVSSPIDEGISSPRVECGVRAGKEGRVLGL